MRLLGNDDAASTFIKLPNILKILANSFGVPAINAQIKQIADQIVKGVFLETNWAGLPYTGKLRADILSILKMFGFAEEFDDQLVLGDAVVIARVLEDAALRLVGKPYFHDASRGQMPEQQVKDLLVNMVAFSRQYWAQLDFRKPFPEHMRHLVTEPMLWLVQEDLTVGAISLKLLMPYIVFPNAYLAEIDDQLNGIATYNSIDVTVSDPAYIEAPLIVKESSSFDCKDFITRMRRDYGSKILYNTSTKKGKTTIHDAYTVPTITFRDHEKFHFGKKLNVKASNNIINDAGRIFADVMHFQAKGDMYNSGQLCFVDSLKANINGTFTNDIIVLAEYEEVNGTKGKRTYTGHAARNAIKENSGQIIAIGDGKGLFDVKTGKDFNHRGIIDVNDVKIVANGTLKVENLPDQFIVRWDPGAASKKGMDCFSIASAFTPSEIRARDGSVKLVVGGDAKIYASLLAASDDIMVEAKGLIKAEAKGESYLSNVSIQNGRRNRTIRQESDIIIQKVQLVAGGNVRMIAHKNVDIKGGDIVAGLEVEMVGENINLTPIQLIAENKVKEYGSRGFSYYKNKMIYSTANVATTNIHANAIKLAAKHDVNIKASILMAMEDININAGNNINIVEELVEHYVNSSHFGAHLNFFGKKAMERVLNNDLKKAERHFNQVKNDLISEFGTIDQVNRLIKARNMPDALCEGAKAIMDLYKEFKAYEAAGSLKNYAINSIVQKVGQASISAEFSNEKKQWFEAILPVMKAKNIIMKAGNHIKLRGLQAKAETMSLEAKGNIDIQAAQEYYSQHQRRREIGLRAQANYEHGNGGFGMPTIGVFGSYASSGNKSVKNLNAHIDVQTFTAKTPNTLTLEGANIVAHDVKIQAHALLMKSLVDTENGRHKSISGGIDLNLATGQLSGHVEGSKGSYNRAKVNEQTGITALGEFIAEIGDVTHLQGAFIEATNGVLQSKRFIHEDMQEHDQSTQIGFGIGCFDFSRNAAFIMPDINYASKNQKNVLKAGVSSGVQIVTQSDISTLNRDLKRAREIVKDHKHYVRVIVPIPTGMEKAKNALEAVGQDLRSAFDYLCNNRNAAVDPIPQFVKNEIKEDLEAHERIAHNDDWDDATKEYAWDYYQAVKNAERYGTGLAGKDQQGHNRYGEVKVVNGAVEIHYTVYEKEVFAEKLAERIMLEAGKDNNEANRQKILPIMRDLLDEYNDKYKNRALTSDLLQDVHEFPLYYGTHAGDDETPDAYNIRKVALPLAIPAGAAAWEGMCFLGGAIAGWFGWQQTKEYLKENNYVDDDENPIIMHGNGPIAESFPAHTQDGPNIMWTPAHDERGLQTLATPEHNLGLRVEGLPIADPLPKLGGFDISDKQGLNVFETRKAAEEGDQVHHVIPQNDERYKKFWEKTGLYDQDECNLLDLPGREKAIRERTTKAIHQGRHDKDYHKEVMKEVKDFLVRGETSNWSQEKFTQEGQKILDKLKGRLNEGDLHVNRSCERLYNELKGK